MLGDGSGERVLDRDDGGGHRSALDPVEYFHGSGARNHGTARQHLLRGFMAEGTAFALNRNFDGRSFSSQAR